MIAYRDFVPRVTGKGGFLNLAKTYESFDHAVAAANEWIAESSVKVIHVETVVLPNIWSPHEEGTRDAALVTQGEWPAEWHQFVRVWYETS
jgi:hypothetical protein